MSMEIIWGIILTYGYVYCNFDMIWYIYIFVLVDYTPDTSLPSED